MAEPTTSERNNVLAHLYRGELGRMTAYRIRLDTTTNWALGTTAAMVTFALSRIEIPHSVFGLIVLLDAMFLHLESNRFRTYEALRRRVRLLEEGFFAPMLGGRQRDGWEQELAESLDDLKLPLTQLQAMSVRLRRTYLWLVSSAYVGWYAKLHQEGEIFTAARLGPVPGYVVVALAMALWIAAAILTFHHHVPEEG